MLVVQIRSEYIYNTPSSPPRPSFPLSPSSNPINQSHGTPTIHTIHPRPPHQAMEGRQRGAQSIKCRTQHARPSPKNDRMDQQDVHPAGRNRFRRAVPNYCRTERADQAGVRGMGRVDQGVVSASYHVKRRSMRRIRIWGLWG
jgi:hypothetical protein